MILVPGAQSAEGGAEGGFRSGECDAGGNNMIVRSGFRGKDSHDDNRRHNQKSYQDVKCFCHGYSHKRNGIILQQK